MSKYAGMTRARLFHCLYLSGDVCERRAILAQLAVSYGVRRVSFDSSQVSK